MKLQKNHMSRSVLIGIVVFLLILAAGIMVSCSKNGSSPEATGSTDTTGVSNDAMAIAEARGLTPDDISASSQNLHALWRT